MASRENRGSSLAELMVYCALAAFIFTGVVGIFKAGLKYYNSAQKIVSLQQQAMMSPYRMARELMESSIGGVKFYPNSSSYGDVPKGVVFISARDPQNNNVFAVNSVTGRPRWKKYVCYYEEHTVQYHILCRKEYADPAILPDGKAVPCIYDTTWFSNNRNLKKRVIATNLNHRDISVPGFEIYSGDPESGTREVNNPFNPICMRFNIQESTDKDDNALQVTLQVSTRN